MSMKYARIRYLCELAKIPGVSTPAAKNVDKPERLRLVVRSPSKGGRRATVFHVPVVIRRDKRQVSLPCNAHIASACPVSHVHGGWPYTKVREARMSVS